MHIKRTLDRTGLIFLFLINLAIGANCQVVNLPCQNETEFAAIDLDRKAWAGIGNTTNHSEGLLHNFDLPLSPADCKIISNVQIDITVFNVDISGLTCTPPSAYYINIATGCPSLAPASCDPSNLVAEPNSPNFNSQNLSYNSPPQDFQFGDNLSIDIVPVMDVVNCPNGNSAISSGEIILEYQICVTVTIIDATPTDLVDLGATQTVCPDATTLLDAGTFSTYQWGPNGEVTPTITVGDGVYTVTVTDAGGCSSTDIVIVDEFADGSITFDPTNPGACDGGTVQVSVQETYSSYMWSNSLTGQIVNLDAGNYTVTVTDINNCTSTAMVVVDDIIPPNPGIDNFLDVCNDGTLYDIDAQLTAHDAGGTWSDDDLSGINLNTNSTSVDFSSLAPGFYAFTYTVTGSPPCPDDQATISIQVFDEVFTGISNAMSYCPNPGFVDFYNLLSNPNTGGNFSDTNGSGINLSDGFNVNLDGLAPGTYEYVYTLATNGPCPGSFTELFITILAAAEAGENDNISVCEGAVIDLNTLLSFDADLGGTFIDSDASGGLTGSMLNTSGLAGQTFNFSYLVGVTGGPCGTDMATFTVSIESSLSAGVNSSTDICENTIIDLSDVLMAEDAGGVYSDITGNGGLTGNMLNVETLPLGISVYQYLIGDGISCPKDSATISINVLERPTIILSTNSLDVCPESCETFTITITGQSPFSIGSDFLSLNGNLIGASLINTNANTYTLTACNQTGPEGYVNDTLFMNLDSSYLFTLPVILDNNCPGDMTLGIDTVMIQALDFTRFSLDIMACISDTLEIGGMEFFDGNSTFTDTIPGQLCDSIINISIAFMSADTLVINPTICLDDSVLIMGTYYDIDQPSDEIVITNPNGCDSLIQIDLIFHPLADSLLILELCSGDSIEVNGTIYKNDIIFTDTLFNQSELGCDSLLTVDLTFDSEIMATYTDTLCSGQSIILGGITFNNGNPSGPALITGSGCDTILNVEITFLDTVFGTLQGPFCESFSTVINGTTYDFSNTIGQELLPSASSSGCDSLVDINLSFYPPSTFDLVGLFCDGEEFEINGTTYDFDNPIGIEPIPNGGSNGCDSIININLTFYPPAEFDLTGPLCEGEEVIVNGNTYDIDNPTGIEPFPNGSSDGCDSTVFINLTFEALFVETVDESICIGDSLFVGGAFQFTDGTYIDTIIGSNNCDSIVTTNLTFMPCVFLVNLIPVNNICAGGTTGSIIVETGSPEGFSYNIRLEDENQNSEIIGFQSGPNVGGVFSNLEDGTYTITIFDTNNITVYTNTVTITSTGIPISGSFTVSNPITCENGTGGILFTPTGGQSPYQYSWNDPSIGNMPNAENITAGSYQLTVTDDFGCTSSASFNLQDGITQTPDLQIMDPSCDVSTDGSIQILGLAPQNGPYTITVNGNSSDSTLISGLASGNYEIQVIDVNLCEIIIEETLVADNNLVFADYTESYSIEEGDSVSILGTIDPGAYTYLWMTADNSLSCTDCALPIARPVMSTTYELQITDENGCMQSIMINIEVTPKLVIDVVPNIFSPNGDNTNDDFIFRSGSENITSIQLNIFDRWGNLIYQEISNSGSVVWDGSRNGKIVNNGVYIYSINIQYNDNETKSIFGDVTLIN